MAYEMTPKERMQRAAMLRAQREARLGYTPTVTEDLSRYLMSPTEQSVGSVAPVSAQRDDDTDALEAIGKGVATGLDLGANVGIGALKSLEGIFDIGASLVGTVGGWFSEDFKREVEKVVEYQAVNEWVENPLDELGLKHSYLNDFEVGEFVGGIAQGVGGMLPAVVVTALTAGTAAPVAFGMTGSQLASLGVMAAGAAGNAAEEALNDGADLGAATNYGLVSGSIEGATEKLTGGASKWLIGKGIIKGSDVAEQGLKRILKNMGEEAVEEGAATFLNPAAKTTYKGAEALKEYGDIEFYGDVFKDSASGALVAGAFEQTVGRAAHRAGADADIYDAQEAIDNIVNKKRAEQAKGIYENSQLDADAMANLENISKTLKKASPEKRAKLIERHDLSQAFTESGEIKPEFATRFEGGTTTPQDGTMGATQSGRGYNKAYYSADKRGSEAQIASEVESIQESLRNVERNRLEQNGLDPSGADNITVKVFDGELSEQGKKNLANAHGFINNVSDRTSTGMSMVVVDSDGAMNGVVLNDSNTIYIDASNIEDGTYLKTMVEEVAHFSEGTESYGRLLSFIAEDEDLFSEVVGELVADSNGYGFTADTFLSLVEKSKAGGRNALTGAEKSLANEIGAHMVAETFGNERFMQKVIKGETTLAEKMIARVKALKNALSGNESAEARTERKRLEKAEKLWMKSVEDAGYKYVKGKLIKRLREKEEEEKTASTGEVISEKDSQNDAEAESESGAQFSFSSISNSFFGDPDMTVKQFENGKYKETTAYQKYVNDCVNNMKQSRKGLTEKAIRAEVEKSIDGIVRVAIAMKKAGYDIYDDPKRKNARDSKNRSLFSSLEPNSDYFTSSDISTICDKRKNFAQIYDDIVKEEERRGIPESKRFFKNVDNYFYIHKVLADKGLTQPCKECYVESMRKNLAPMANAFLELIRETDPNNKKNKQLYDGKGKLKANNSEKRERMLKILDDYGMTAYDLNVDMITTEDGLAELRITKPEIYEEFNSFYGQSKPKMPRGATPFRFGELTALLTDNNGNINWKLVDKINHTGGFRLQSYSDFQVQNFADVLQVIFEAGTLGLNGHAYTKVPMFLDVTKGTNLKRNISIFMYNDGGEWKIDKNDSFPGTLEEIYKLVENDKSGNTSIIAVSQNADMSAWIMANDLVGYGIPFHKSGLKMDTVRGTIVKEGGREILGYKDVKDHTKQQTEVYAFTTADHKANTKVKKSIDIYEFWDFKNVRNLSKQDLIKKNLMKYIDKCEEVGYRPKFREYLTDNKSVLDKTLAYAKKLGFVAEDATVDAISFKYKGYRIPYGYYKFLGDFGMFTPDGKASPQKVLSLAEYDFDAAVDMFKDSEALRRKELLQQFANDGERQKMIESGASNEELEKTLARKRSEVVDEIVNRGKKSDAQFNLPTKSDFSEYEKPINAKDVETLRAIGRKSINAFTDSEIVTAQKWAHKFYKELGTKSPFFRAWFGDWRAFDKNKVSVIEAEIKEGKNPRGVYVNKDTGWKISSSSVGYDETISHSGKDKLSLHAMRNIDKIIENAVLLDTETSEYGRGKKSVYTAFMHKFYSLVKIGDKMCIAKMAVDESYSPGQDETNKKFYHVRSIEIETAPTVGIGESHTPIIADTVSDISISDLFAFVKAFDKEFSPKPVNELLLNDDGTPKVFYHGTNQGDFTEFLWEKTQRADGGFYGRGHYFTASKGMADLYGKRIVSAYLSAKKPFVWSEEVGKLNGVKGSNIVAINLISRINLARIFPSLFSDKRIEAAIYDDATGEYKDVSVKWSDIYDKITEAEKDLTLRKFADGTYQWFTPGKYWDESVGDKYNTEEAAEKDKFSAAAISFTNKYQGVARSMSYDDQSTYTQENGDEITKLLIEKKYDAAMQNPEGDEVVIFDGNQIKSATDNIGTFSGSNDIQFSLKIGDRTVSTQGRYKIDVESAQLLADINAQNDIENYLPKGLSANFIKAIKRSGGFARPRLYRGMDASEFDYIFENGFIKSNSSYNFSHQQGRTYFSPQFQTSLSYATGFAPSGIRERFFEDGMPAYIVEVGNYADLNFVNEDTIESYTNKEVDVKYITRIIELMYDTETEKVMARDIDIPGMNQAEGEMVHGVPLFYKDKITGTILYAHQDSEGYEDGKYISEKNPDMLFDYNMVEEHKGSSFDYNAFLGISGDEANLVPYEKPIDKVNDSAYNGVAQFSIDATNDIALKELDSDGNPIYETERQVSEPTDFVLLRQRRNHATERYQLSNKQRVSLEAYVMGIAYFGNKKSLDGKLNERDIEYVQTIVEAAKKFPIFRGRTYRNLKFRTEDDYNAFLAEHALGSIVPLRAITSTSKRPNGYPLYGKYVVHLVIDGESGRDIADTFGIPKQQEVLFVPETSYTVGKITTANDGNPMIFVKEIANNGAQFSEGNLGKQYSEYDGKAGGNRDLSQQKRDDVGRVFLRDRGGDEIAGGRDGKTSHKSDVLRETEFSLPNNVKRNANRSRSKTYTRDDAKAIADTVLVDAVNLGEYNGRVKGKTKLVDALWKKLNDTEETSGKRGGMALDMADAIIESITVSLSANDPLMEVYADRLNTLRGYMHKLNLDSIKGELKSTDRMLSYYARWHRNDGKGMTPDQIVEELRENGIVIDADNPADILRELDRLYSEAADGIKANSNIVLGQIMTEEELEAYRQKIAKDILKASVNKGSTSKLASFYYDKYEELAKRMEVLTTKLNEAGKIARQTRDVIYRANRLKAVKLGTYHAVSQYSDKTFKATIESLGSITRGGQLMAGKAREICGELDKWMDWITDEKRNESALMESQRYDLDGIKKILGDLASMQGDFSLAELQNLSYALAGLTNYVESYGKIRRQGKLVEAKPIVEDYVKIIDVSNKIPRGVLRKMYESAFMGNFADPATLMRYADGYDDGFFTQTFNEFREGAVKVAVTRMELMQEHDAFMKSHKKYADHLAETVEFRGHKMTRSTAIALWMTSKRAQAQLGLVKSGIKYRYEPQDKVGKKDANGVKVFDIAPLGDPNADYTQTQIDQIMKDLRADLDKTFTDADRAYIAMAENIFDECGEIKREVDILRTGVTNVADGYYFPIVRADKASSMDTESWREAVDRVNNLSMNKDTVKGAKSRLFIGSIDTILKSHVNQVALYNGISTAVDNYNVLVNLNVGSNNGAPISINDKVTRTDFGKEALNYLKKLKEDIEQINRREIDDRGFISLTQRIRGNYATYQLGANPKVWVTQLSSLVAANDILDADSIAKGMTIANKKLADGETEVDKYCPLAKQRNLDNVAYEAQSVSARVTNKIGEVLMLPVGKVDRFVVERLWGACQVQIEKNGGAKVGTVENKTEAGKLLQKVILETQQNALPTERSSAMRSTSEIKKTLTMFSADAMKIIGRVFDGFGRYYFAKQRLKAGNLTDAQKSHLESEKKSGFKQFRKATAVLLAQSVLMAAIALGFKALLSQLGDKEPEEVAEEFAVDAIGNTLGGLPIFRDVYGFLAQGYELDSYLYSSFNDMMTSVKNVGDLTEKTINGEATSQDYAKSIRSAFYSAGQIFGIPTRNLYKYTTGIIETVSPETGYAIDSAFTKPSIKADLKKAIEAGDTKMIARIAEVATNENYGMYSESTRKSLKSLVEAGYTVFPRSVGDTVTVDGETYELSSAQKKRFDKVYAVSDKAVEELVKLRQYKSATDEEKAKALKYVYDTYYSVALDDLMGTDTTQKSVLFAEVLDVELLAMIVAHVSTLTADKDKDGKTVNGSRKQKIVAYVNSLNLSAAEKYMVMGYLGYSNTNGKTQVESLINRSSLSRTEKATLLAYSGYSA